MATGPSIVERVKKFHALQEERVLTYKLFEEQVKHKMFISNFNKT